MGAIIARLRRKPSTQEELESIQADITLREEFKRATMAWHKKLIWYLLTYFSLLYLTAAGVAYQRFYHHPNWQGLSSQLVLWVPFLVAPLIFLLVRRLLTWWCHRKIRRNETKLADLHKKKKKILEDVMETETYKAAKEILEKYAPEQLAGKTPPATKPSTTPQQQQRSPLKPTTTPLRPPGMINPGGTQGMEVRRRLPMNTGDARQRLPQGPPSSRPSLATSSMAVAGGPVGSGARVTPQGLRSQSAMARAGGGVDIATTKERGMPGPPLPRPVLPRERGYMDRLVEYLVGDGPANRYALICKQCQSHNGMALKEEFEYIAYRCCYCYFWNPARKQRPVAPRLEAPAKIESSSESSEDENKKKVVTDVVMREGNQRLGTDQEGKNVCEEERDHPSLGNLPPKSQQAVNDPEEGQSKGSGEKQEGDAAVPTSQDPEVDSPESGDSPGGDVDSSSDGHEEKASQGEELSATEKSEASEEKLSRRSQSDKSETLLPEDDAMDSGSEA